MENHLNLACVLHSWQANKAPHPLHMWGLIDISNNRIVKFFLFYKIVKFHNITRKESAPAILKKWIEERRKELGLHSTTKGQLFVKKDRQESSRQIKQFLNEIGQDFQVIYVDDFTSQGVPWGDSLIETLCNFPITRKGESVLTKMQTLPLNKEDVVLLRRVFAEQVEKLHASFQTSHQGQKGEEVVPDVVVGPDDKITWLSQIGQELEEWVSCEDEVMSHKPTREAWAEAFKMKRNIEKQIAYSVTKTAASQEVMLQKQDVATEQIQKLSAIVQDIKDHLQKKREKSLETRPLRDEIKYELYQTLMDAPTPRYTLHAHRERARKRIVFTLLYYTGARVNELRQITYNDVKRVLEEGRLKLVLHKQSDAIVRVIATVGREEMKKLAPEIDLFFKEQQCQVLGQSFRKPGQVMHEKSWINYINKEIANAKQRIQINDVLSSHSFRVGFVTRHLKHADSHKVSKLIGHKNIGTTLKYNRYVVDEEDDRKTLDRGYKDQQKSFDLAKAM